MMAAVWHMIERYEIQKLNKAVKRSIAKKYISVYMFYIFLNTIITLHSNYGTIHNAREEEQSASI